MAPPGDEGRPGQRAAEEYQGVRKADATSCSAPAHVAQVAALPDLAERINALHGQALAAAHTSIERAIECGRLLLQAKASIGHGGWLDWVEANLSFGDRQARKYMRVAANGEEIVKRNCGSDLGINEALKLLSAGANDHFRTSCFTGCNERYTPAEYIDLARRVLGRIDLDPASSDRPPLRPTPRLVSSAFSSAAQR